jgi:hypothetical protein
VALVGLIVLVGGLGRFRGGVVFDSLCRAQRFAFQARSAPNC